MKKIFLFLVLFIFLAGCADPQKDLKSTSNSEITMAAKNGDNVTVKYKGKLKDGTVFDEGEISFVVGAGKVIKGFDDAVRGMNISQSKEVLIPAKDAYGAKPGAHPLAGKDLIFFITLKKIG